MSDGGLREHIIDAATRLFAERGFSATSIREVVEACSCTKPSLYYYFENKETMFSEIVNIHLRESDRMIEALTDEGGTTREAIKSVLTTFANWAENNPFAMRLLQRVENQAEEGAPKIEVACAREMHVNVMQDLIERGQKNAEVRSDIDPFDCALIIAGSLSFQFELYLATENWDLDRLHRTVDLIFDGIAP